MSRLVAANAQEGPNCGASCSEPRPNQSSSTGVPRSSETPFPQDPTVALCLGTYGGTMGVGVSHVRGTPVEVDVLHDEKDPRLTQPFLLVVAGT